jgi:ribose transport system permease protein
MLRTIAARPQTGLALVILLLGGVLTVFAGTHVDPRTGQLVNNFLNWYTLIQTATDASFFAIMAVGATVVIISGGIDLSVGSIYAMAGVGTAMVLRAMDPGDPMATWLAGLGVSVGIGLLCGALNGTLVVGLGVHPFIITLGTMWIVRGVAFVVSHAESILVPGVLTSVAKASLGFGEALYPVPMLVMLLTAAAGGVYLTLTVRGRHVFAVGGNAEASRFAGVPVSSAVKDSIHGPAAFTIACPAIRTLRPVRLHDATTPAARPA